MAQVIQIGSIYDEDLSHGILVLQADSVLICNGAPSSLVARRQIGYNGRGIADVKEVIDQYPDTLSTIT